MAQFMPQVSGTFKPEKTYDFSGIDQINTFNGGLTLQIPIGPRYQSGSTEYGLTLTFNSAMWQHDKADEHCSVQCGEQSRLAQRQNAGAGWAISLGGLILPTAGDPPFYWNRSFDYIFFDGAGGEHSLFDTLHHSDLEDSGDPGAGGVQTVSYSRDGSYLRMKKTLSGSAVTGATIEFPDGRRLVFDSGGEGWAPGIWLPSKIQDPFGDVLSITYFPNRWEIRDRDNRVQKVFFASGDPLVQAKTATRVELTYPAAGPAAWDFVHTTGSIRKPWPMSTVEWIQAPQLTTIQQPDGSWFEVSSYDTFGNPGRLRLPTGGEIRYTWTAVGLPGIVSPRSACLKHSDSSVPGDPDAYYNPEPSDNWAVRQRTTLNLEDAKAGGGVALVQNGNTLYCWWENTGTSLRDPPTSSTNCYAGDQFQEQRQTTIAPDGTRTDSYFSVFSGNANAEFSPWGAKSQEYGRPYVKDPSRVDPTGGGGFISSEVSALSVGQTPPSTCSEIALRSWVKKAKSFVTYADDFDGTPTIPGLESRKGEAFNTNARLVTRRTIYLDDCAGPEATCHWTETAFQDFDGLGHYRQETTSGRGQSSSHTAVTDFLPVGQYPGSFAQRSPTDPWVLGLYSGKRMWQTAADVIKEATCFDYNTGFLLRRRLYKSGADQGPEDALQEFTPNGLGQVQTERYYGGDEGPTLDVGELCTLPLPAVPDYVINHTYDHGVRVTSQHAGMPYFDLDRDIYPETGLTHWSRDVAGVPTEYVWDEFGRVRFEKPSEMAETETAYYQTGAPWPYVGTPTRPIVSVFVRPPAARVTMLDTAGPSDGFDTVMHPRAPLDVTNESWYDFDGFGRPHREEHEMPVNDTFSVRTFGWDAMGRKTFESMPGLGAPHAGKTEYLDRDYAGRPSTVRPPDGAVHDQIFTYRGVREMERTVQVRTVAPPASETDSTTTERYDALGRLVEVVEPNGVLTRYDYDPAGRLTHVCQKAEGALCGQERSFGYDGRGFLAWEKQPELDGNGYGLGHDIDYEYDARGHLVWRKDGVSELFYVNDDGERLVEVRDPSNVVWKSLEYGTYNSGSDLRLGKLVSASRRSYVSSTAHFDVSDFYTYAGRAGRLSGTTEEWSLNDVLSNRFSQSVSWTDLGKVESRTYPDCTFGCDPMAHPYKASFSYQRGWLTGVASWIEQVPPTPPTQGPGADLTYHTTGRIKGVFQRNGLAYEEAADPFGLSRPLALTLRREKALFWKSEYLYDGAGNVTSAAPWVRNARYDLLSRWVGATLQPAESTRAYSASAGYDEFGNLTGFTQNTTWIPVPANTGTNRLTAATYDAAGNVTAIGLESYVYDPLGKVAERCTNKSGQTCIGEKWAYGYGPTEERVISYRFAQGLEELIWTDSPLWGKAAGQYGVWTLRDEAGRTLVERRSPDGLVPAKTEAYVWRGDALLGSYLLEQPAQRYFALDHLGSVRAVTDATGAVSDLKAYEPYGFNAAAVKLDERRSWAGHERDLGDLNTAADDLDYMHARNYSPTTGRFLSIDRGVSDVRRPQTLNRYAYALGNPIRYVDPTGACVWDVCTVEAAYVGAIAIGAAASVTAYLNSESLVEPGRTNAEVIASDLNEAFSSTLANLLAFAEHTKGARPSTREGHEKANARRDQDRGGEKGDERRRPPRRRPHGWKGPWPPPEAGALVVPTGEDPGEESPKPDPTPPEPKPEPNTTKKSVNGEFRADGTY